MLFVTRQCAHAAVVEVVNVSFGVTKGAYAADDWTANGHSLLKGGWPRTIRTPPEKWLLVAGAVIESPQRAAIPARRDRPDDIRDIPDTSRTPNF